MYMSVFQFAETGAAPRRREQPEEGPRRRQGAPQQKEAALPDGAVHYIAQAILQEGAPALAEKILAEAPAPAVGGWTADEEALEKVKEEAEALKRAAALQLSA
jgi:hypothetical protein